MEPRHKLLALVGTTAILAAGIFAYSYPGLKANAKIRNEIVAPAKSLPALRTQVADTLLDVTFIDDPQAVPQDPLYEFAKSVLQNPEGFTEGKFLEYTDELLAHPTFLGSSPEIAVQNTTAGVLQTDALFDRSHMVAKILCRALLRRAHDHQTQGDVQATIQDLTQVRRLLAHTVKVQEPNAVILVYGIESELAQVLHKLAVHEAVQIDGLRQIDEFLVAQPTGLSVFGLFTRQVQEYIQVCRNLDNLTDQDFLDLNAELQNETFPSSHPQIAPAMEARLIRLWLDVKEEIEGETDDETVGCIIDRNLQEYALDRAPSNDMVRNMGAIYEQYGRNMTRVAQAKAVLRAVTHVRLATLETPGKAPALPAALAESTVSNNRVLVTLDKSGDNYQLTSYSQISTNKDFPVRPLAIEQLSGVRALVPSP